MLLELCNLLLDQASDWWLFLTTQAALFFTRLYTVHGQLVFANIPLYALPIVASVALADPKNTFYWKNFSKDRMAYIENVYNHKRIKWFLRLYISLLMPAFLLAGLLKALLVFFPSDGLHARDMWTEQNIFLAYGYFMFFFSFFIFFKAYFYFFFGIIDKPQKFKPKMMLW